jgi:hypothetical protein
MSGTIPVAPSLPPAMRRAATGAWALERDRRESIMSYSMPSDMNSRLPNLITVPSLSRC